MVVSSPITSSDAERTTSVHQRRGSGASVRSGTGTSWGEGREKRDSSVSHRCVKGSAPHCETQQFRSEMPVGGNRRRLRRRSRRAAQAVAERGGPLRRWRSGAGRSGGGGQREGHADLGAP